MKIKALISSFFAAVVFVSLSPPAARADDSMPIMPLSEIKPGMTGEWHTVVSGSRVDSFPMEVVGIVENFIGPQRPVIICKALDATNKLTGPVAGMSGSPVFINGKLIGAYAYGWTWPKDQALIGVTPIEIHARSGDQLSARWHKPKGTNSLASRNPAEAGADPQWLVAPAAAWPDLPAPATLQSAMKPLPTPLFVSGISERTLRKFSSRLSALGLDVMQAPSGRAHDIDNDPKPGQPLAGVLMSGDFHFAGTGTVTWRHGNRILAFGHPFLQSGPAEMPMASAEILTVVQSVARSFKLSNTGPVIGTIYQDRLTAIAGEIGRKPNTTHFEAHLDAPGGKTRFFQGELFQNQMLSPIISAISLLESLYDTMESEEQQTIYLDTTLEIPGHEPVRLADAASGEDGAFELVIRELDNVRVAAEQPLRISEREVADVPRAAGGRLEIVPAGFAEHGPRRGQAGFDAARGHRPAQLSRRAVVPSGFRSDSGGFARAGSAALRWRRGGGAADGRAAAGAAANARPGAGPPASDPFASKYLREAAGDRPGRGRGREKSAQPAALGRRAV